MLDGDVIEMPLEENLQQNPHLQSNLFIGKNIIKHVQEKIIYSTNHMQRYAAITKKDPLNNPPINSTLLKETSRIFNKNRGCKYDINNTPLSIAALREDSVGNCFEMSLFGHKYGEKFFPDQFIEPASIQPGDHLFLIIGRPPETSIESYKLWPDSVVICDPWSGACYPASQLEGYLFDYVGSEDIYLNSDANREEKLNSPQSLDETTSKNYEAYTIPRITNFNPVYRRIKEPSYYT